MRRWFLLLAAFLLLSAGAIFWWWSRPLPVLNVVTWPGTYGRAQAAAQMQAYAAAKRADVRIQQWAGNGTLEELQRAIETHHAGDVVDLEMPVAVAACKAGLLEPIDAATLPAGDDGTAAKDDFYGGLISPCWVASALYSQMVICTKPCPGNLSDLFDSAAIVPGPLAGKASLNNLLARAGHNRKIGLQRTAKVNLEMALLADGVNANQVYALLATDAGVARAFAKLDTIKSNIVWWRNASEPASLLRRGQVAATTILTSEAQAVLQDTDKTDPQNRPWSLMGQQFYEADVLALPKSDARKDRALDYLRFATASMPLANMVKFAPYMPPRKSSLPLVEKLAPSPLRDFVIAQKGAMDKSFAIDDAFWDTHGTALEARFRAWASTP
ncbi:MAG: extracellular solute-binding protein [Alphaproteobacteria bacterium]|nr:extracellular solute-binding protein [Alphaproteobacteria bacterium]